MGRFHYHTLKLLCEDSLKEHVYGSGVQTQLLQQHEIIRTLDQYSEYVDSLKS